MVIKREMQEMNKGRFKAFCLTLSEKIQETASRILKDFGKISGRKKLKKNS